MTRFQSLRSFATVTVILMAPNALLAGAVADSSSTYVQSIANIGSANAINVIVSDTDSQGATLSTLASSADAVATDGSTSVASSNSSTLSFLNAGAGTAIFNTAWAVSNLSVDGYVVGSLQATYTFQVMGTGLSLSVDYGVEVAGTSTFGLTNYSFSLNSLSTSENYYINNDIGNTPSVSGTQTYSLIDGETYTLTFMAGPNVSGGINGLMNNGTGTFNFNIGVVPEPSSVVLAGLGMLGLAGFSIRSRRSA